MHFVEAKGILTCSGGYYGMNIYRGCTHSCIYCDSRSRCYQFTHSFEEPILPFINDTDNNITAILNECVRVGVKGIIDFGMGLTLREGDREYYYAALDKHFPGKKERYIKRYGNAYELPSPNAIELMGLFQRICKDNGILSTPDECFGFMQELPDKYPQMSIFDL